MSTRPTDLPTSPAKEDEPPNSRNVGSKTLARGLRALEYVAGSEAGVTVQELAAELQVHRTIAYRVVSTLEDFKLVFKDPEGRYRAGAGLSALAHQVQRGLRETLEPYLRELARELQATVSLLVAEGDEAVAISVVEPPNSRYHLAFRTGSRHPLDRGAAGHALRAAMVPAPAEPEVVTEARRQGYASTWGEVEPGAYGVAIPLRRGLGLPAACVNLITNREDIAERAVPVLLAKAEEINAGLS
ncbi:helix-turn-helix domain-containing protein [Streptomyces sp. NPDC096057]|uniref:IclR family transcriptional regulator n=1 Tax=Streptomyces sp. NPDC096057 TaxID=3155543 RepID=UPI0033252225